MIDFKDIELSDRQWMDRLLQSGERGSLEYSFVTNYIWRNVYRVKVAQVKDYLVIVAGIDRPTYLFPCGQGPLEEVIEALLQDSKERGIPFTFHAVLNKDKSRMEKLYPGKFQFIPQRDAQDYVYLKESLATLTGKKLSSKRNHINRFIEQNPNWVYEPITEDNIEEAHRMSRIWCKNVGCGENPSLRSESCAVEQAFQNFFDLRLAGGLLRTGGEVVAFSMGDRLNETTYHVHIEKAFAEIQGAYQMINKQFVLHNCEDYTYVNREDDAGDEGLRKAKLSYVPYCLVEKHLAKYVG